MLTLEKGSRLNLAKESGLDFVRVGLGWTEKKFESQADFDLDASAFVCDASGCVLTLPPHPSAWMLFYNQLKLGNSALEHSGDERTGASEGDDETITIDFTKLPPQAAHVAIVVTIHDAHQRRQNFGMIQEAHARIYDKTGLARAEYKLMEDASTATSLLFVEFKKNGAGEWVMMTVGEGFKSGLEKFCEMFKVPGY
jgi:tellurium resistance protein TerD